MTTELYDILKVKPDASEKEIRNAYRSLAKKYHPDLNPGNKAAEETFRKVQGAYDILSDADKRRQYDAGDIDAEGKETGRAFYHQYGGEHPSQAGSSYASHAGFEDIGNIFSDLFRAQGEPGGQPHIRMRGGDVHYKLDVAFLDAALGAKRRLQMPDGHSLDVTIPPGHGDGQMLRLKGKGMPGLGGGAPGDALIEVRVKPDRSFRRRDRDILVELPIAIHEAVLGGKVPVDTIHGPVSLNIPAGSDSGDTLRLKGKGLAARGKLKAGDQLVTLQVKMPKPADEELRQFLKDWSKTHSYNPRTARPGAAHDH